MRLVPSSAAAQNASLAASAELGVVGVGFSD
jgi:hypothetical protein